MRSHLPRTGLLIAGGALATLVLSAGPALAGQRGEQHGGQSHQSAAPRSAPAGHSAPAPQSHFVGRPQVVAAPQSRGPVVANRGPVVESRSFAAGSRFDGRFESRAPVVVGHAAPRAIYGGSSHFVAPRYFVPTSHFYGRAIFSRPYFAFRPRYTFGFGLAVGYPVAFPYGYYYSPYADSYGYPVYGYAEPYGDSGYYDGYDSSYGSNYGSNYVDPNAASYGGVSFDIQQSNAAVYIDGKFIGTVAQFSSNQPPLSLTLGRHHVDIRLAGYQTMSFDADIIAGQVTPYQGSMTPIR